MADIVEALLKVQQEIQNPKNTGENPFSQSKYAPLPDVLNQVRPLLSQNGIVLVQNTGSCPTGELFVQTRLLFSNGNGQESIESDKLILTPDKNKKRSDVQAIGSSITYGRRYQLMALLGIVGEGEDDDGSSASNTGTEKAPASNNKPAHEPKTSKTSQTTKNPKTGTKTPKTSKTAKGNGDAETQSVVQGNIQNWKTKAQNNPALKKVLDNLNQAGLDFHDVNIQAEAEDMNNKKILTDGELNKVMVALGKAPG